MARHFAIVSHEQSNPVQEEGKGVVGGDAVRHQKARMLGRGIKSAQVTVTLKAFVCKCHRVCVCAWNGSRNLGFRLSGFRVLRLCLIVIGWSELGTSPGHCLDSGWTLIKLVSLVSRSIRFPFRSFLKLGHGKPVKRHLNAFFLYSPGLVSVGTEQE